MSRRPNQCRKSLSKNRIQNVCANPHLDSVTEFLAAGFYRVKVLSRNLPVAEYFVVKGYPMKSYWCVLSSHNHLETHLLFKTLSDARDYCVYDVRY